MALTTEPPGGRPQLDGDDGGSRSNTPRAEHRMQGAGAHGAHRQPGDTPNSPNTPSTPITPITPTTPTTPTTPINAPDRNIRRASTTPAHHTTADGQNKHDEKTRKREVYAQVFAETIRFLETMSTTLEQTIDPRDPHAISRFFAEMADDITVDAKLPTFAAGTMCSSILRGMHTLSRKATAQCAPRMATAAGVTWRHGNRLTNNYTPFTGGSPTATAPPEAAPPHNVAAGTDTDAPHDAAPYLNAARGNARPISRLPTVHRNHSTVDPAPIAENTTFSAKLRARAAHLTDSLVGPEQKNLIEITSDTTLVSPTQLRNVLALGGIETAIAVLPTDDSRRAFVCAGDSTLDKIKVSYDNFVKLSRASRRQPPALSFRRITDVSQIAGNPGDAKTSLRALRREIARLEGQECKWPPRHHFSRRIREMEAEVHASCTNFHGTNAPPALAPYTVQPRPNKRVRSTPDTETHTTMPVDTPMPSESGDQ